MPRDVLQDIQSFANGGQVDKGVGAQLSGLAQAGQQDQSFGKALSGMYNAYTNNGSNVNADTMGALAKAGTQFAKAMERADLAMYGIHGSMSKIDSRPLANARKEAESLAGTGPVRIQVDAGKAYGEIKRLRSQMESMLSGFTSNVSVDSSGLAEAAKIMKGASNMGTAPQKFAKGGIAYHRRNQNAAHSGGIFSDGRRSGDKEMIFVNGGEGIITASAISRGAKQVGMSPRNYVNALNHPGVNLGRIKKGRSFATGGVVDTIFSTVNDDLKQNRIGDRAAESIGQYASNIVKIFKKWQGDQDIFEDIYKSVGGPIRLNGYDAAAGNPGNIKAISESFTKASRLTDEAVKQKQETRMGSLQLKNKSGALTNSSTFGFKEISTGLASAAQNATNREDKRGFQKMANIYGQSSHGGRNAKALNAANEEVGLTQEHWQEGTKAINEGRDKYTVGGVEFNVEEFKKKANQVAELYEEMKDNIKVEFSDVFSEINASFDEMGEAAAKKIPFIGKLINNLNTPFGKFLSSVALSTEGLKEMTKTLADFAPKMADMSAKFTLVSQSVDTFSGGSANLEGFRKGLNMTREEAGKLGEQMALIGKQGVHGVSVVTDVAANLKNALGKVDTTALQEAVAIIKDIPKGQVDVLFGVNANFDDKANLMANLISSDQLDKTIDVMMKGAFGEKEGSVQLDAKDKAVIEAQQEANQLLEDIKMGLYKMIPGFLSTTAVRLNSIINITQSGMTQLKSLWKIFHGAGSGLSNLTKGFGESFGNVFKGQDFGFKNLGKIFSKSSYSSANWVGGGAGKAAGAAGGVVAGFAAGAAVAVGIYKLLKWWSNKQLAKEQMIYEQNKAMNKEKYGVTYDPHQMGKASSGEKWGGAAKGALAGGLSGAAIGALVGSIVPAVGTMVGGIVGAVVGSAIGGLTGYLEASREKNAYGNAFVHEEKGAWYGLGIWGHHMEKDQDADKLKANHDKTLQELDQRWNETHKVSDEDRRKNGGKNPMLMELVNLNKHVKNIEMIAKGKYTAYEDTAAQADLSTMKMASTVGGSNKNYMESKQRAFGETSRAYSTNAYLMGNRKAKIMSEMGSQGVASTANALNKVIIEETKMHEKYIKQIDDIINEFGKLPSVMVNSLKAEMHGALQGFMGAGGVGGIGFASMGASQNMQASDVSALLKDRDSTAKEINSLFTKIGNEMAANQKAIEQLKNESGIGSLGEAEAEASRIKESNKESFAKFADIEALMGSISDWEGKASAAKYASSEEQEKLGNQLKGEIKQLTGNAQRIATDPNASPELREFAENFVREFDESKVEKMSAKGILSMMSGKAGDMAMSFKNMQSKAISDPKERERYEAAQNFIMLNRAQSSAGDAKVALAAREENLNKKFIEAMDKTLKSWNNQLDKILQNGSVQFYDQISKALRESREFDAFGGVSNVQDVRQSEFNKVLAQISAFNEAKKVADENIDIDKLVSDAEKSAVAKQESLIDKGSVAEQATSENTKNLVGIAEDIFTAVDRDKNGGKKSEGKGRQKREGKSFEDFLKKAKDEAGASNKNNAAFNEVKSLMVRQAKAAVRLQKSGGHDAAAMSDYNALTSQLNKALRSGGFSDSQRQELEAFGASLSAVTQVGDKLLQAEAAMKRAVMDFSKGLKDHAAAIANSGQAMVLAARQSAMASQQSYVNQYVDSGQAASMRSSVAGNASRLYQSQMSNLKNGGFEKQERVNIKALIDEMRKSGKYDEKQISQAQAGLEAGIETAKYEEMKRVTDEYMKNLEEGFQSSFDSIRRRQDALTTQSELLETVGGPFEQILDIQKQMVGMKQEEANIEAEKLAQMQRDGVTGAALEEQKLKVIKAQAEVTKAAYGAQRDAIDKLLGKMFGTFNEVGGLFGPDGPMMQAAKLGQGYVTNKKTGMSWTNDGPKQGYEERVAGNRQAIMQHRMPGAAVGGVMGPGGEFLDGNGINSGVLNTGGILRGRKNDKTLIRVSDGEMIINAKDALRNGGASRLFAAIKSGAVGDMLDLGGAFADGGVVQAKGKSDASKPNFYVASLIREANALKNGADAALGAATGGVYPVLKPLLKMPNVVKNAATDAALGTATGGVYPVLKPLLKMSNVVKDRKNGGSWYGRLKDDKEDVQVKIQKDVHKILEILKAGFAPGSSMSASVSVNASGGVGVPGAGSQTGGQEAPAAGQAGGFSGSNIAKTAGKYALMGGSAVAGGYAVYKGLPLAVKGLGAAAKAIPASVNGLSKAAGWIGHLFKAKKAVDAANVIKLAPHAASAVAKGAELRNLGMLTEMYGGNAKMVELAMKGGKSGGIWSKAMGSFGKVFGKIGGSFGKIFGGASKAANAGGNVASGAANAAGGASKVAGGVAKTGGKALGKFMGIVGLAQTVYGAAKGWQAAKTEQGIKAQNERNKEVFGLNNFQKAFKSDSLGDAVENIVIGSVKGVGGLFDFVNHGKNIGAFTKTALDVEESVIRDLIGKGSSDRMLKTGEKQMEYLTSNKTMNKVAKRYGTDSEKMRDELTDLAEEWKKNNGKKYREERYKENYESTRKGGFLWGNKKKADQLTEQDVEAAAMAHARNEYARRHAGERTGTVAIENVDKKIEDEQQRRVKAKIQAKQREAARSGGKKKFGKDDIDNIMEKENEYWLRGGKAAALLGAVGKKVDINESDTSIRKRIEKKYQDEAVRKARSEMIDDGFGGKIKRVVSKEEEDAIRNKALEENKEKIDSDVKGTRMQMDKVKEDLLEAYNDKDMSEEDQKRFLASVKKAGYKFYRDENGKTTIEKMTKEDNENSSQDAEKKFQQEGERAVRPHVLLNENKTGEYQPGEVTGVMGRKKVDTMMQEFLNNGGASGGEAGGMRGGNEVPNINANVTAYMSVDGQQLEVVVKKVVSQVVTPGYLESLGNQANG